MVLMTKTSLVDPELARVLDKLPNFGGITLETLADARTSLLMPPTEVPVPPGVVIEERRLPGPAGAPEIPALLYRYTDRGPPRAALLHIHGGGYVAGNALRDDEAMRILAGNLGLVILSVDYRLAPETPFPGGHEDCYAALVWLQRNAEALGVDPARIGIRGNSAGGGLAAGVALMARDRGGPAIAFQLLLYPMIDDRTGVHPYAGEHVWPLAANRFGWRSLLGHEPGIAGVSPYAAPARADNLAGLPPAFIAVGALDLFVDENIDYAKRLIAAGVPTELKVYPGAYHGFDLVPGAKVADDCKRDMQNALARGLATRSG